jgi:hypothetical protein
LIGYFLVEKEAFSVFRIMCTAQLTLDIGTQKAYVKATFKTVLVPVPRACRKAAGDFFRPDMKSPSSAPEADGLGLYPA